MSCNEGLHNVITIVLDNKPWFKYKKGDSYINIVNTRSLKINDKTAGGVAETTALAINELANRYYPGVGDMLFKQYDYYGRGYIAINPTNKQLDFINAKDEEDRKYREITRDDERRQQEGNWTVNDEGDVVPRDDFYQTIFRDSFTAPDVEFKNEDELIALLSGKGILTKHGKRWIVNSNKLTSNLEFLRTLQNKASLKYSSSPFSIKETTNKFDAVNYEVRFNPAFFGQSPNFVIHFGFNGQRSANAETVQRVRALLTKLGIEVEEIPNLFKQHGISGVAKLSKMLIQVQEGMAPEALTEEFMHFITFMLPKNELDTLFNQITEYSIYKQVYEMYKDVYQKDGKPDVTKIKLEAIGKLLAEAYIFKNESLSKEEVNLSKTLWGRLLDLIRSLFGQKNDLLRLIDEIENNPSFLQTVNSEYETFLQALPTLTPREKLEVEDKVRQRRKEAFDKSFTQFRTDFKSLFTVAKNLGANEQMLFQLDKLMKDTEGGAKVFSTVEGYFEYLQGVNKMLESTKQFAKELTNPNSPFHPNRVTLTYWTITFSDIYRNQINFLEDVIAVAALPEDNAFYQIVKDIKDNLTALEQIRNRVVEEGISEKIVSEMKHINDAINAEADAKIAAVRAIKNKQKLSNQAKYQKIIDEIERKRQSDLITKENISDELHAPKARYEKRNGKWVEIPERRMGLYTSNLLALHMNPNMLVQSVDQVIKRAMNEQFSEVQSMAARLTNLVAKAKALGKDFTFIDKAYHFAQEVRTQIKYINGEKVENKVLVLRDKVDHIAFHNEFEELNENRRARTKEKLEIINSISSIDPADPDAQLIEENLQRLLTAKEAEIEAATKKIDDFIANKAEKKYTDEYYQINNELPQKAREARQEILDQINEVSYMVDLDDADESTLERLDELWLQFIRLESLYNEDGSKKVGDDLEIAEAISEWKKVRQKEELMISKLKPKSQKLWLSKKMRMDDILAKAVKDLSNNLITQAEYDTIENQVNEWYKRNVRWTPTEEFYEERKMISEDIDDLMIRWGFNQDKDNDPVSILWEEIFNIIKGYRNAQGYINAREIHINLQKLVQQKETQIENLKESFADFLKDESQGTDSKALQAKKDRAELIELFEKLKNLQEKVLTPSEDDVNLSMYHAEVEAQISMHEAQYRAANPVDYFALSPTEQQAYNDKVQAHAAAAYRSSAWYAANHVAKTVYDNGQETVKDTPSYIWWVIKPTNPNHIQDEHPTQRWYTASLNPKYLRFDTNGKPMWLGPDDKMKPREGVGFDDLSYNALSNEEKSLLEEFKRIYFELQAMTPKYARLGYVVPHVRSSGWDARMALLRGKSLDMKDAGLISTMKSISGFFKNMWSRFIGRDESDEDYLMEDDEVSYEKLKTYDRSKLINIKYLRPIGIEKQSFDLIEAIGHYGIEAHRYASLHKIVPFVFGVKEFFNTHPVREQDRSWSVIKNHQNQRKLITEKINRVILRDTANNRAMSSVAKNLNSLSSKRALLANIPNDLKNFFAAIIQQFGMSGVVQISTTDLIKGYKTAVLNMPKLFADTFRTGKPSKYMRKLRFYDAIQGNAWDSLTAKMTVTAGRVITDLEGWLSKFKESTEPILQAALFEAISKKHFIDLNGTRYRVVDLYQWNDATEKMELAIDLNALLTSNDKEAERKELEKKIANAQEVLRNDIRLANQLMLGQYATFDQPYIKRYWYGRIFMNMKSFLPSMFIAAFGKERIHYGSGRTVQGLYHWFLMSFVRDAIVFKGDMLSQWQSMTPRERSMARTIIRHNAAVITTILGYYALTLATAGDGDDDKEDDATEALALLMTKKITEEVRYFHPIAKMEDWVYRYFVTKAGGKNIATEFINWTGAQTLDPLNVFDTRSLSIRYSMEDFSFEPYRNTNKGEYYKERGYEFYNNVPAIAATFARLTPLDNWLKISQHPQGILQSSRDFDPMSFDYVSKVERQVRETRSDIEELVEDKKREFMEERFGKTKFKELNKTQQKIMRKYSKNLRKKFKVPDKDELRKAIYHQADDAFKK